MARLGGGVCSFAVRSDWGRLPGKRTDSKLDLLLVDPSPEGFEPEAVAALIEEARELGAGVLSSEEMVPPVDPRVVNPIGFRWSSDERLAAVGSGRPREARLGSGAPRARGGGGLLEGRPPRSAGELERLRAYRGVVDHAALHPDVREQAAQIVRLGAGGVPVILKQMSTSLLAAARRRAQRRARAGPP